MSEVGVAFPNDEASAEAAASRLRADGIAARVDRGLHGSWQVGTPGHITVLVAERDAARAREMLGEKVREERDPGVFFRLAVAFLAVALLVALAAVIVTVVTRP